MYPYPLPRMQVSLQPERLSLSLFGNRVWLLHWEDFWGCWRLSGLALWLQWAELCWHLYKDSVQGLAPTTILACLPFHFTINNCRLSSQIPTYTHRIPSFSPRLFCGTLLAPFLYLFATIQTLLNTTTAKTIQTIYTIGWINAASCPGRRP